LKLFEGDAHKTMEAGVAKSVVNSLLRRYHGTKIVEYNKERLELAITEGALSINAKITDEDLELIS